MNQRQFGRHSESCLSDVEGQISLFDSFNEAEYLQQNAPEEPEISKVVIPSYRRSKASGKRETDLEGLPSRVFEHKLSEEEFSPAPDTLYPTCFWYFS